MKSYCIPIAIGAKLKEAFAKGEMDLKKLADMGIDGSQAFFEKFADPATARKMNTHFRTAVDFQDGKMMKDFLQKTLSPKEKKSTAYLEAIKEIQKLQGTETIDVLKKTEIIDSTIKKAMGISLEDAELTKIFESTEKIKKLASEVDQFGNPDDSYWRAMREQDDYILSLAPSNRVKIALHTIGRGNMMLRASSVVANTVFNAVKVTQVQTDRVLSEIADSLVNGEEVFIKDGVSSKLVSDYVKSEITRFKDTGFSMSRMVDYESGKLVMGEERTHSQGPGVLRAVGRVYEDKIFGLTQGVPDVAVAAASFANTARILANKAALQAGFKGAELQKKAEMIFKDTANLEPQSVDGIRIRNQAMQDAFEATNTHNSALSGLVLSLRHTLDQFSNKVASSIKPNTKIDLATAVVPFAKTPANAIASAIDSAGLSALRGFADFATGATKENRDAWTKAIRNIIRSGLAISACALLLSYVKKDSYTGEYSSDPKTNALRTAENINPNSVTLSTPFGEKNLSIEYLGPLQTAFVGMLYARDYASQSPNGALNTVLGMSKSLTTLPGLSEYRQAYDAIDKTDLESGSTSDKVVQGMQQYMFNFILGRAIPGFVTDIGKISDKYERKANKGDLLQTLYTKFPILREMVPVKTTFTGEQVKTESALTILLAGSRIKTPIESGIVKEFKRLDKEGLMPAIPNLDSPSGNLKELQQQIGDAEYQKAKDFYRKIFREKAVRIITSENYAKSKEEIKRNRLNSIEDYARSKTLKEFKFKRLKVQPHSPADPMVDENNFTP